MAPQPKNLECFEVIHPRLDMLEEKCHPEKLGPMPMSRSVEVSLLALRAYSMSITLLLIDHVLGLAGVKGQARHGAAIVLWILAWVEGKPTAHKSCRGLVS